MKKILLFLSIVLLLMSGCSKKVENYNYEISGEDLIAMKENKETFAVFIGTTTCSACANFKPIVEEMNKKYGTKIYHNTIDLESEEMQEKILEYFPVEYTPSTHLVVDGETVDLHEGSLEFMDLKKFLDKNDFIK